MEKSVNLLAQCAREELMTRIIPFWQALRDDINGGYCGMVGYDLKKDWNATKGCILNSRILWFFSNAYQLLKSDFLLEDARHAFNFLKMYCVDQEHGGVYWSQKYDGRVNDSTKHTYNQAFAIYALSSYYLASNDPAALELALELFHLIETRCRDEVGFLESFTTDYQMAPNGKLSENGVLAYRTMNTVLHVLEAYTELYRACSYRPVADALRRVLDLIREKIYDHTRNRLNVFFDKDMTSIIDLESYGHDIEAAWLIDRACFVLHDESYSEKMAIITTALEQKTLNRAFTKSMLLNECCNGEIDATGIWWVQAEGIVGFINAYLKDTSNTHYLNAACDVWSYICDHQIDDRPNSEWLWAIDENCRPIQSRPIVNEWKCPYHNGRMCFELIGRTEHAS